MRAIPLLILIAPLVISSRMDQEQAPPDSLPPEPKSRFAMLDDVKILANGLLQLGHGLKDFVHKTKTQINDIFQKLNVFDRSVSDLSLQTNEIKEEERELRRTTSNLQAKNEEMKTISLELSSKLEDLLEEKVRLQQKVRGLEEKLMPLVQSLPEGQEHHEVTFLKTFVEQQDQSIKELFQTVQEQYQQLNRQHGQIQEMENQLRKTGFQEAPDSGLSSKQRAPRTVASLGANGTQAAAAQEGMPADCAALSDGGSHPSGVYAIRPGPAGVFHVYCEMKSGSSWTVIQQRVDGSQNFNETWENYQRGFGSLEGEFWLGLEKIHAIVKQSDYILRIELEDWKDNKRYIEYLFSLGSPETDYALRLSEIQGNIPSAIPEHRDLRFATWDHNAKKHLNCPESYSGGWWGPEVCGETNLNGKYVKARARGKPEQRRGLYWKTQKGRLYSLKTTKMLIHPTDLESFE
ncbi:angiopoietin-related protein 3 [Monodelphis domestica]|uniref:angiopoietin-related protein 3 n=1 Tax=Monodelphis domestica TaxID=13616 RepID=UPI0024E20A44|nr:angiopoietin-related protein 3 [Monodelphis domestica]